LATGNSFVRVLQIQHDPQGGVNAAHIFEAEITHAVAHDRLPSGPWRELRRVTRVLAEQTAAVDPGRLPKSRSTTSPRNTGGATPPDNHPAQRHHSKMFFLLTR
jgi:hypothetical protein